MPPSHSTRRSGDHSDWPGDPAMRPTSSQVDRIEHQAPAWHVVEERGEYDLELVLAKTDQADDDMRLVVTWGEADDEPEVLAVYPCGTCGWAETCKDGCHV